MNGESVEAANDSAGKYFGIVTETLFISEGKIAISYEYLLLALMPIADRIINWIKMIF